MTGDCASDPPLSATLRAIACARPEEVLLGLAALGSSTIAVRHDDAEFALREAAARMQAKVEIVRLPDAWPPNLDGPDARVLLAASPRHKDPARYVTVAGAVHEPCVLPIRGEISLAELALRAGGPLDDDWLPLVDHSVRDRDQIWAGQPLVLILPARHPLIRKARTPLADWLLRAASACEGCRICSEACGHLQPHEIVWTLATMRDDGTAITAASNCINCGICDAMCPSALSPRALVVDVRDRLKKNVVVVVDVVVDVDVNANANANGLDVQLLTLRLGLADYDRAPLRKF